MTLGLVYHMPFWRDRDGRLREIEGSFARYVDSLAPYFDEIVLCVPVLTETSGDGTLIRARNVRLAPLRYFDGPAHFYPRLPAMVRGIVAFVRAVDVLHCRVPTPAAVFAVACARLFGRPVFLLVVGDLRALLPSMPYRGLKRLLWRSYTWFEERGIQWMVNRSLTFANGAALASKHSRAGRPVVQTQTTTIDAESIAQRIDTMTGDAVRLFAVSRIDPRKGLRVLPGVVAALAERGVAATVDIVGPVVGAPGDAERAAIVAAAAARGVSDRVRLLGAVPLERLLPLYADYDAFVLPTLPGEGVPRVLLEAMAAGLPIVTTPVAGIPSLVTHERNGLIVDEPSADAVASAIVRLVRDGALRRRLIQHGYESARAHTLQAQAGQMMDAVSRRLGLTLRQPVVSVA
ncbi:MAG TPA: glycosyltransferase family 4 protein [Vicinamibacterales bacterium]|nr:glycosyltransferase family 4 protein [Vicinamibacterales bacterium]